MQKTVLIVTNVDGNGGSEESVRLVANYLCHAGYKIFLYTLRRKNRVDVFRKANLTNLNKGHGFFLSLFTLPNIIKTYKPDIVLSFLNKSSHVTRFLNRYNDFQHVLFFNSIQITFLDRLFYKYILPIPKKTIAVADSRITRHYVERKLSTKIDFIIPPFFLPQSLVEQPLPKPRTADQTVTFGVISRLSSEKGIWSLLCAVRVLCRSGSKQNFRIKIAGEGKEYRALIQYIFTHGLPVEIIGHIENKYDFLQNVDAYIQPSLYEGFCLAIHEALSCGLMVIASNKAGEITFDKFLSKNNIFFKAGDPYSICRAMERFLALPQSEITKRQRANKDFMLKNYPRSRFDEAMHHLTVRLGQI